MIWPLTRSTLFPYTTLFRSKCAHVWEVESGQEVYKYEGHTAVVTGVAYFPDGHTRHDGGMEIGRDTSELQSRVELVCRLLLEKKKRKRNRIQSYRCVCRDAT